MKISGFTFVRNAVRYDYPVVESITSILPLCDELVVAVGQSDDGTRALIEQIASPKIRIIDTVWDDALREGGRVLAVETNKALDAINSDADWAFYIQADEVLHEKDLTLVREAMLRYAHRPEVEGLLFNYRHFYGSYDYLGSSRRWYRREIRVIRNDARIRSYKDAQGFRIAGRKLRVKQIDAHIHHYGWVKHPSHQQAKQASFNRYWHDDQWMAAHIPQVAAFDYSNIDMLRRFEGTHPAVMQPRIAALNWTFSFDPTARKMPLKERLSRWLENITGWRFGEYRNYKII